MLPREKENKDSPNTGNNKQTPEIRGQDYYNVNNWIVELQSPLVLFTGLLL